MAGQHRNNENQIFVVAGVRNTRVSASFGYDWVKASHFANRDCPNRIVLIDLLSLSLVHGLSLFII